MQVSFYLMDVTLSFFCQIKFVNGCIHDAYGVVVVLFLFFIFIYFSFFVAWYIIGICITWSQICRKADRRVLWVGPSLWTLWIRSPHTAHPNLVFPFWVHF